MKRKLATLAIAFALLAANPAPVKAQQTYWVWNWAWIMVCGQNPLASVCIAFIEQGGTCWIAVATPSPMGTPSGPGVSASEPMPPCPVIGIASNTGLSRGVKQGAKPSGR